MRIALPSTTALRVFDAAARHLSCTGAADELCLTQSAVSKQLRTLEESLGVPLFVRINRGLVLTEAGRAYLDEIRPLLVQLANASMKLASRQEASYTVTMRILAIVGDRWLLPRFGAFTLAHPNINVQFTSLLSNDGVEQAEVDAELRGGEVNTAGYVSDYLFGREAVLVAAPSLLAANGGIESLADLHRYVLLEHFGVPKPWAELFAQNGLDGFHPLRVQRFEFYSTLLMAAVRGMGVALVPAVWAREEISRGELVNPLACSMVMKKRGYYLMVPEHKQHDWAVSTLRKWLLQEAATTRASIPWPAQPHEAA